MTTMSYKGYEAIVEYDEDAGIFHGDQSRSLPHLRFVQLHALSGGLTASL